MPPLKMRSGIFISQLEEQESLEFEIRYMDDAVCQCDLELAIGV